MVSAIQKIIRTTDSAIARMYLSLCQERSALRCFLFHSLFRNEAEVARNLVDPLQRTTLQQFRQFIEYYMSCGYHFVGPDELMRGLQPGGRYAMITFDDGYYSSSLARHVLEEFNIPGLFFISTNHVRENRCFWWDVLYRERAAQGASHAQIYREAVTYKGYTTEQIESQLIDRFGRDAFRPRGDVDRPMTPVELRDFASSENIFIGNHTANHAILTNYSPADAQAQIMDAQSALLEMTGRLPVAIAYPNGNFDERIVETCRQLGLRIGVTTRPHKNPLWRLADPSILLQLGRFCPHGEAPMLSQCRTYRSDLLIYGALRAGYIRWRRPAQAEGTRVRARTA